MIPEGLPDEYRTGGVELGERVLGLRRNAIVGTRNPDGSSHLAPVWFYWDGENLHFETHSATRKARNVARDHACSALVYGRVGSGSTTTVLLIGQAHPVRPSELGRYRSTLRGKYVRADALQAVSRYLDDVNDMVILVRPERRVCWSGEQIDARLQDSLGSIDDGWLLED